MGRPDALIDDLLDELPALLFSVRLSKRNVDRVLELYRLEVVHHGSIWILVLLQVLDREFEGAFEPVIRVRLGVFHRGEATKKPFRAEGQILANA